MKLILSVIEERRWLGVVEYNGDLYKVILFPGSATTDWQASLQPTSWVEMPLSSKIGEAVVRGHHRYDWVSKNRDTNHEMLKAVNENHQLMERILNLLKGEGKPDGTGTQEG